MLSRAADSLYWMSRYLERAEHSARLINAHLNVATGESSSTALGSWQRLFQALNSPGVVDADGPLDADRAYQAIHGLTFERSNPNSLVSCIGVARENARQVREQLSLEMWEQINRMYLTLNQRTIDDVWNDQPHAFFRQLESDAFLFRGITDETIVHDEGWYFIQVGLFVERLMGTAHVLDVHYRTVAQPEGGAIYSDEYLQWIGLLRSCSAFEAYCRTYSPLMHSLHIGDFLMLSSGLPRSLRYSAQRLELALHQIARQTESRRAQHLNRLAGRLHAQLRYGQIDEIFQDGISAFLGSVMRQCDRVHSMLYETYVDYPVEEQFNR